MTIVIAGERSGVGKTTITLAILAYLCDRVSPSPNRYDSDNKHTVGFPASTQPTQSSKIQASTSSATNLKSKTCAEPVKCIQNPLVQSFKVGPDYIDPMFHTYVTGRPCRNLDPVLTSEDYVRQCFSQHSQDADYGVVEGVMGLFDGASGSDDMASTAHIARLLNIPIVLVLDCGRLSRSVAAIIHGYTTFDPRLTVAGVILNRVGSDRHLHLLKTAIEPLKIPILGVLRREAHIAIPDRHLGLVPTDELPELDTVVRELRAIAATSLNWELLLPLLQTSSLSNPPTLQPSNPKSVGFSASTQPTSLLHSPKSRLRQAQPPFQNLPAPSPSQEGDRSSQNLKPVLSLSNASKLCIAVARDRAFNFYYPDNLDLLEQLGATLVFWSPLKEALPDNIQGLYLGGGFPEVFGAELAANQSAQGSVREAIAAGLPTYAECGGLMYLCQAIVDFDGNAHAMVGVLPTTVRMGKRLSLGYRRAIAQRSTPLVTQGQILWGHEFHRSHLDHPNSNPLYNLRGYKAPLPAQTQEGWAYQNLHASYIHVHWGAQPTIPQRFLDHCRV